MFARICVFICLYDYNDTLLTFGADILEELTSLETTFTSSRVNRSFTPSLPSISGLTIFQSAASIATPISIGIATPQRLNDLNVVSQRLALLRQMSSESF